MVVKLAKKYVSIATTSCYVFGSKHPFLILMVFVLIWMHRSFPFLFSVLLYASPVIASTLLLLGTLLFFGQANEPESNDQPKPHSHIHHDHSSAMKGNDKLKHRVRRELRDQKARVQSFENKKNGLKSRDSSRRTSTDSSSNVLGHRRIDDDDNRGWETGSDLVESASLGEMFPDLLLDSQVSQMHYAASDNSHESGDMVNETDDDDDDDYSDDDQDDIDEDENVILWTEDDQRNVMNMGTSESERNQRLANLIARQKTLRNLRIMAEKNMANVSPDLHFNAAHVTTGRNNPFDLPHYDSSVNNAAPSVMIPLRHPFDFPYDPSDMKHNRVGPTFPTDDPFLGRRHERFATFGGPKQGYNLGTYFVPDGTNCSTMNRTDTESIGSAHTEDNPSCKELMSNKIYINSGVENARNDWSSSIFCDVTDDINDDDDEIEDFKSIENPTEDSEDLQISDDDHSETSHAEGGWLPQRLKSWLTGWKA